MVNHLVSAVWYMRISRLNVLVGKYRFRVSREGWSGCLFFLVCKNEGATDWQFMSHVFSVDECKIERVKSTYQQPV